ncbi:Kinesin-like protein [Klebsormidium nitens]|uniref:Kinesin-like protein n=1 Tax=Klebsormidium nitens TaxID=105231 RepID=A0A1Y1I7Y7_KLENI|nr:Kinesin-like protein [Klebsormidium nitens]|eukprot:GAQ87060.1 Kinesin-like protein [Klebsormidium nitens]
MQNTLPWVGRATRIQQGCARTSSVASAAKQAKARRSSRMTQLLIGNVFGTPMIADREAWDLSTKMDQKLEHLFPGRARHVARVEARSTHKDVKKVSIQ